MTYNVGDTVYVETTRFTILEGYETTVRRVTPSGRVIVGSMRGTHDVTFNADGYERGAHGYHTSRIVDAKRWVEINASKTRRELVETLRLSAANLAGATGAQNVGLAKESKAKIDMAFSLWLEAVS